MIRLKNTAQRISKYPKDRIAFIPNQTSVAQDKETFALYKQGIISIELACERIAESNDLYKVTAEQFLNTYNNVIGWGYALTAEDYDKIDEYAKLHSGS